MGEDENVETAESVNVAELLVSLNTKLDQVFDVLGQVVQHQQYLTDQANHAQGQFEKLMAGGFKDIIGNMLPSFALPFGRNKKEISNNGQ